MRETAICIAKKISHWTDEPSMHLTRAKFAMAFELRLSQSDLLSSAFHVLAEEVCLGSAM